MPGCSAVGCSNRTEQGYSMKRFPKDPHRRAWWRVKVRRQDWIPTDDCYLCEAHFEDDQWQMSKSGKRRLKRNALPTIFHHTPILCKRKPPIPTTVVPTYVEPSVLQNKKLKSADELTNQENKSNEQILNEMTKLKQELMSAREAITKLCKENRTLKLKLRVKTVQLCRIKKSINKQDAKLFNEEELEALYEQMQ